MNSSAQPASAGRVLLINLNHYDQPYPVYPLGLAYVDGALRAAGYTTRIWDVHCPSQSMTECATEFRPDFVGLSMRNIDNVQAHNPRSFTQEVLSYVLQLRAVTTAPLILGGCGFSIFPKEIFELTGVDYGIQGEGERTLVRLLAALRTHSPLDGIDGLLARHADGSTWFQPRRGAEETFTSEPYHNPEIVQAYVSEGSLPGVQTQRGCPLKCCYCTYPLIEGTRGRYRTGADVAREMKRLAELGAKQAFFVDSVFNTRTEHVVEVCEAILRENVKLAWECFLRPGPGITPDLIQLMQRAGLCHVEFGSDSFSDPVLHRYGKSFDFAEIQRVSELAHRHGLRYSHFIIFGGPGETPDSVEETIARAALLPAGFFFATIGMRIYPGTPLWRTVAPEQAGETLADYLEKPRFYIERPLTMESLYHRLELVKQTMPNWALGDPPPEFMETLVKLRRRGIRANMWEYVELLQRLSGSRPASGK